MVVAFVNRKSEKKVLSSEVTNYILPNSGNLACREIKAPLIYVNGDSYKVDKGSITIPVNESSIELEIDDKIFVIHVLCRRYANELKFDYNAFGAAFKNNLIQGKMDEKILFEAFETDDDNLKIPLCTFNRKFDSITKNYDVEAISKCTDKLPHIFNKPKQHLKQVNDVRPAAVVSRIGQEAIRHLASHSEHWKGIKASGLIPERLLARTLEDDCAIYENLATKTMVDKLYHEMKMLNEENIDCYMQMNVDDGHAVSGEQKIYFHARDILLKGMDDEAVAFNQLLLEEQQKYIFEILEKLGKCRSTSLYRTLKKAKPVHGKLKKTNIFMMDKYYKYVYELWNLLENRQKVAPYDTAQDIKGEYALFCKTLFIFALRYFQFRSEDQPGDVFVDDKLGNINYSFDRWNLVMENAWIEGLDIDGFATQMSIKSSIKIKCSPINISPELTAKYFGVKLVDDTLLFDRVLDNKEQENFIKRVKTGWPKNKQKNWTSELKQKLYTAFANVDIKYEKALFVPWKYLLPDNTEDIKETLRQIKAKVDLAKYDKVYLLIASRPNEFSNVEDGKVLSSLLSYGKANAAIERKKDNVGVIPIGLNDINSYRRYTKILLEQMIALDAERKTCPICGDMLNLGRGDQKNIATCHTCGFQIINTKCSHCGQDYTFTRYILPKSTTMANVANAGFKIIAEEHKFGFKNITDVFLEDGNIHPLCPHCGK